MIDALADLGCPSWHNVATERVFSGKCFSGLHMMTHGGASSEKKLF
jgi:hypothetical protein